MKQLSCWGPYAAFMVVSLLGLAVFHQHTPVPVPEVALGASDDLDSLLERQRVANLFTLSARRRIVKDLVGRRLALTEAAERFRDLNEATTNFCWGAFRQQFPGTTDDERCFWQVLSHVRFYLQCEDSANLPVVECLEKELRDLLQGGELRLTREVSPGNDIAS